MTLAEQIQAWDEEKEYTAIEYGDYVVILCWQGNTYKIPFYVLDDLLNEWIKAKQTGSYKLGRWLNSWKTEWCTNPVDELKIILEPEMPHMEAYKLYHHE